MKFKRNIFVMQDIILIVAVQSLSCARLFVTRCGGYFDSQLPLHSSSLILFVYNIFFLIFAGLQLTYNAVLVSGAPSFWRVRKVII